MTNFLRFIALNLLLILAAATHADAATWYVKATGQHDGNGSKARPFHSLEAAEAASGAGDTIYILQSDKHAILDGQIVLKPDQKLIGLGPDVTNVPENAAGARMTYSGGGGFGYPEGAVVQLSTNNEISNIHFKDFLFGGIVAIDVDFSGANIHDNLFTGGDIVEGFQRWSVDLESSSGNSVVTFRDNVVRDGVVLGGILAVQGEDSSGTYHIEGNHFENIGFNAHALFTSDTASLHADILDSSANNIGALGEFSDFANADSIYLQLSQASTMDVVVDGYTYDNTDQVGGVSNTGLELFLPGEGLQPPERWANSAEATLKINNSSFGNAVTEAIQLLNTGVDSVIDVEITNTTVFDANPRQAAAVLGLDGGAIAVLPNFFFSSGNQTSVMIENSDIIGSTGYGVAVYDVGATGFSATLDMGGGDLASIGQNRVLGNAVGDVALLESNGIGRFNWWGGDPPVINIIGGGAFDTVPELLADPRP
ncbi:MAG: hypothetical protein KJO95_04350 [Gammaproteobacteria bacterium]|nr:hypothetical protein [Gammaproteobacteria bacterium]